MTQELRQVHARIVFRSSSSTKVGTIKYRTRSIAPSSQHDKIVQITKLPSFQYSYQIQFSTGFAADVFIENYYMTENPTILNYKRSMETKYL